MGQSQHIDTILTRNKAARMATILVVDDDYGTAELLEVVLIQGGHDVLLAAGGKRALEMLKTEQPDLMFLDYLMPDMDGAAVLVAMAESPSLQRIPVVLMSSEPEAKVVERCRGHVAFMRKPLRLDHIRAFVERLGTFSM